MLITSALKKFAAATGEPDTTKLSAFSLVPINFKLPAPVISILLKLTPGDIVVKPSIAVLGVNALVDIIAAGFDRTSNWITV